MSQKTPDFFDLVGDEGTPDELAQLRRFVRDVAHVALRAGEAARHDDMRDPRHRGYRPVSAAQRRGPRA